MIRMVEQEQDRPPTGLAGVGAVRRGSHLCHLYSGVPDLLATMVPFFGAGLEYGDRCIWVAPHTLGAEAATAALEHGLPGLRAAIHRGQLSIVDQASWFDGP